MARPLRAAAEIEERDMAQQLVARYIADDERVDIVVPRASRSSSRALLSAFLPAGYPQSVTKDYLKYQIYDSLQAFSSSIAGLLSSRAVLEGVGVGDGNASPTSALLLSVLQDSMGRVATILFAHKLGTSLEPECKMYRFLADIFNDAALILDCLSPAFPKAMRVALLSFSSVLRALCGVAAGSSKASLSAHFATQGNLGELNAKDSSQETIISLLGMLAGSLLVTYITTPLATWLSLFVLLFIHLGTNYLAVRAVSMRTINRQRANILYSQYLDSISPSAPFRIPEAPKPALGNSQSVSYGPAIPLPDAISRKERIFERDGVLRRHGLTIMGHCSVGVPLSTILDTLSKPNPASGSYRYSDNPKAPSLPALLSLYEEESHILHFALHESSSFASVMAAHFSIGTLSPRFFIVLKATASTETQLKAWFHAYVCAWLLDSQSQSGRSTGQNVLADGISAVARRNTDIDVLSTLRRSLQITNAHWPGLRAGLEGASWDMETGALETRSGIRVSLGTSPDSKSGGGLAVEPNIPG